MVEPEQTRGYSTFLKPRRNIVEKKLNRSVSSSFGHPTFSAGLEKIGKTFRTRRHQGLPYALTHATRLCFSVLFEKVEKHIG